MQTDRKESKLNSFLKTAFQVVWMPIAVPIFLFTQYIMVLEHRKAQKFREEEERDDNLNRAEEVIKSLNRMPWGNDWKITKLSYDAHNYNFENDHYFFTRVPNYNHCVAYALLNKVTHETEWFSLTRGLGLGKYQVYFYKEHRLS